MFFPMIPLILQSIDFIITRRNSPGDHCFELVQWIQRNRDTEHAAVEIVSIHLRFIGAVA